MAPSLWLHIFSLMYECCKNKMQCNRCPHWQFADSDCFPPLRGEHLQLQGVWIDTFFYYSQMCVQELSAICDSSYKNININIEDVHLNKYRCLLVTAISCLWAFLSWCFIGSCLQLQHVLSQFIYLHALLICRLLSSHCQQSAKTLK